MSRVDAARPGIVTLTTILRASDGTTQTITITRNVQDDEWRVVPDGYTGRRCALCDMPHRSRGLCRRHADQTYRAARKIHKSDTRGRHE